MMYLGTSGFSYDDWVGNFYPRGLPKREWLGFYAREFNTCEINSTFYALPRPAVLEAMAAKTGEGFLFSIKANQGMTHQLEDSASIAKAFSELLAPLSRSGKLGCVLAQFPYSFKYNPRNRDYLGLLREWLGEVAVVVEFRNAQWLKGEVFDWLRHLGLGFCCVDEPQLPNLLPALAEVTGKVGYIRFHGRNNTKWWEHKQAYERYDYTYSEQELSEWLPKIQKLNQLAEKTFIFTNNHWQAQAVGTIRQLRVMLD